jgi:hypothetical protein
MRVMSFVVCIQRAKAGRGELVAEAIVVIGGSLRSLT